MSQITSKITKRYINFGTIICKVCADYKTIGDLLYFECATRTLSNIYNLTDVRGDFEKQTSMSGPHHYFGHLELDSKTYYVILNNVYYAFPKPTILVSIVYKPLIAKFLLNIKKSIWLSGILKQTDNLFPNTGILEIPSSIIKFNVIKDPQNYDLMTNFKARVVKNDIPWNFNSLIGQDKLRVVTYNYQPKYVDYLMERNGIFIEKHPFVQAITPTNAECYGYVILGTYDFGSDLTLIAIEIPYGYTLLVERFCIHGDSKLVGLYMMAMTGNHRSMRQTDTVFMKSSFGKNVRILPEYPYKEQQSDSELLIDGNPEKTKLLNELKSNLNEANPFWFKNEIIKGYIFDKKL
jgi:hypothetical protein